MWMTSSRGMTADDGYVAHFVLDDGIQVVELSAVQDETADESYTLFHPVEVELQHTVERVLQESTEEAMNASEVCAARARRCPPAERLSRSSHNRLEKGRR